MFLLVFFTAFLPLASSVFIMPVYAELPDGTMYIINNVAKKMQKISEATIQCTNLAIKYYEFPEHCQRIFLNLNNMVNQYLNTTQADVDKAIYG